MNEDTLQTIEQWRREGHRVAVSQVVRTYRSAPRPVGSIFAVSDHGKMAGSVSGGCVEGAIYGEAQELFDGTVPGPRYLHYGISDELAGDVGLACGGELWVSLAESPERPKLCAAARSSPPSPARRPARVWCSTSTPTTADGDLAGAAREAALEAAREAVAREESTSIDLGDEGLLVHRGRASRAPPGDRRRRRHRGGGLQARPPARLAVGRRRPAGQVRDVGAPAARRQDHRQVGRGRRRRRRPRAGRLRDRADPRREDRRSGPGLGAAAPAPATSARSARAARRACARSACVEMGVARDDVERIYGPIGLDIGGHTPAETAIAIVAEVIAHR